MVVEKNQNHSIFLATYWNLSQNSGDLEIYFFEIWKIWAMFSVENPLYRSKSYFPGRRLAKFQKKTLHLRCLLSSWMNYNCAEVYGFVTGVSISSRAALKVRVPGSASTLCRPLIRITELPSGFTPCPPHKALPDFL
jgi:hypothetical protein